MRLTRPAVIVGVLVGLAAGLEVGRNFDAGFRAALVGALVGGVLAIIGGYLGSKELIDRDERRERQDFIGAVQVARSEFSTNAAIIKDMIEKHFANFEDAHVYDSDYRQVITTLARKLPMDLFADLSVTANAVRHAANLLAGDQQEARGGASGETVTRADGSDRPPEPRQPEVVGLREVRARCRGTNRAESLRLTPNGSR